MLVCSSSLCTYYFGPFFITCILPLFFSITIYIIFPYFVFSPSSIYILHPLFDILSSLIKKNKFNFYYFIQLLYLHYKTASSIDAQLYAVLWCREFYARSLKSLSFLSLFFPSFFFIFFYFSFHFLFLFFILISKSILQYERDYSRPSR